MQKFINILENILVVLLILAIGVMMVNVFKVINSSKVNTDYIWNIRYDNFKLSDGSKNANIKFSDENIEVSTILKENEYVEFSFEVVNDGNFAANITNLSLELEGDKDILLCSIKYEDGSDVKVGDIFKDHDSKKIVVRLEYPKGDKKIYDELEVKMNLEIILSS